MLSDGKIGVWNSSNGPHIHPHDHIIYTFDDTQYFILLRIMIRVTMSTSTLRLIHGTIIIIISHCDRDFAIKSQLGTSSVLTYFSEKCCAQPKEQEARFPRS